METNTKNKIVSTGGMRSVLTRGGPLDLGFHHTDPNRLKMTIEMYVSFSLKHATKLENGEYHCLAMRTLGPAGTGVKTLSNPLKPPGKASNLMLNNSKDLKDEKSSSLLESLAAPGVVWSLCVDWVGALHWVVGDVLGGKKTSDSSIPPSSIKSSAGAVRLDDSMIMGEEKEEEEGRVTQWTHIVAVIDSTTGEDTHTVPTQGMVTLYVNCESVASGIVQLPQVKEGLLGPNGMLYVGPCLPVGSRLTELRVVRTCNDSIFSVFSSVYCLTFFQSCLLLDSFYLISRLSFHIFYFSFFYSLFSSVRTTSGRRHVHQWK